jgi:hypothetical protein
VTGCLDVPMPRLQLWLHLRCFALVLGLCKVGGSEADGNARLGRCNEPSDSPFCTSQALSLHWVGEGIAYILSPGL